jgi:hypothetical protein
MLHIHYVRRVVEKPKDVEFPTDIYPEQGSGDVAEIDQLLEEKGKRYYSKGLRISLMENIGPTYESMWLLELTYLVPVLLFGACHLLGWNFWFDSPAEKWLWRVSSITCLALPTGTLTLSRLIAHRLPISGLGLTVVTVYIASRAFLLIDIFAGLRSVPDSVYDDVGWSQWIPHIGS